MMICDDCEGSGKVIRRAASLHPATNVAGATPRFDIFDRQRIVAYEFRCPRCKGAGRLSTRSLHYPDVAAGGPP